MLAEGVRVDCSSLRYDMALQVRGAVANFNGDEYPGCYDAPGGFMHFGTQAVNVHAFRGDPLHTGRGSADLPLTASNHVEMHCVR